MGRPKKSAPAPIEPEDESQDTPEDAPARLRETLPQGSVSQSDAARSAIEAGHEKPSEAVKYIKDKFGLDMNPQYFSSIKTRTRTAGEPGSKKAEPEPARRGPKPKVAAPTPRKPLVEGYVAPPEKPKAAGEPDVLLALEGIKELVDQFGVDRVKRMVDLIG